MACYKPISGFRAPGGVIKFSRSGAYRDLPVTISCGQCVGCRLERSRQWAVRCVHEASLHNRNSFLTLTYDEQHLPTDGSLNVRHWQLFAKKLRHKMGRFRYFHCGEYGDLTGRPHYHVALFGLDFFEGRKFYKNNRGGEPLYTNPLLDEIWGKGYAVIGELNFQSAAYVARYIMKKVTGDQAAEHYADIHPITGEPIQLKPEYITMSRRPGIAADWIKKYLAEVYPSDEVIINGKSAVPPKFYDKQYEALDPEGHKALLRVRKQFNKQQIENNKPDRLETRETVQMAQIKHFSREVV